MNKFGFGTRVRNRDRMKVGEREITSTKICIRANGHTWPCNMGWSSHNHNIVYVYNLHLIADWALDYWQPYLAFRLYSKFVFYSERYIWSFNGITTTNSPPIFLLLCLSLPNIFYTLLRLLVAKQHKRQKKMRNNRQMLICSIDPQIGLSLTWVHCVYNIRIEALFWHLKITTENHILYVLSWMIKKTSDKKRHRSTYTCSELYCCCCCFFFAQVYWYSGDINFFICSLHLYESKESPFKNAGFGCAPPETRLFCFSQANPSKLRIRFSVQIAHFFLHSSNCLMLSEFWYAIKLEKLARRENDGKRQTFWIWYSMVAIGLQALANIESNE